MKKGVNSMAQYVIIGNGVAAIGCIEGIRKEDTQNKIIVISEEPHPVYCRNPAVKDVAVIGLPDPRLGEIAAAIVSVKEGMSLSEDDVNDFCLALPRYKRPRKIIFAEVPRNPTGKIEKPLLRKRYGADALVAQQNGIPA